MTVDIAYEADLDAASSAAGVLDDSAPFVCAQGFGSGTYQLELRWWRGPRLSDESHALDHVVRNVKHNLDAAAIAMPSPERIVRQPDLPDDSRGARRPGSAVSMCRSGVELGGELVCIAAVVIVQIKQFE